MSSPAAVPHRFLSSASATQFPLFAAEISSRVGLEGGFSNESVSYGDLAPPTPLSSLSERKPATPLSCRMIFGGLSSSVFAICCSISFGASESDKNTFLGGSSILGDDVDFHPSLRCFLARKLALKSLFSEVGDTVALTPPRSSPLLPSPNEGSRWLLGSDALLPGVFN